jgi:hypothetical protein
MAKNDLEIVAEVPGNGWRESMSDKYTQLSRASDPLIHGHDGWKFPVIQFTKVHDFEFVASQPRGAAVQKCARKASGQHIAPTAKIPFSVIVVLIQVVDPSLDLAADFR